MKLFTLFIALTIFAFPAFAASGLKVGDQLPTNLELKDNTEEVRSFDALKGDKGLVLFFIRSADWCPYCQVQLLDLRKGAADDIINAGYNVVIVSYDSPEKLNAFATKYKFDFPMLSDEGSETIKAFGILNEKKKPGVFGYGIPHPTIYVVSQNKEIQGILAEESYTRRPEIKDIVEVIQAAQ
jgi:peroxiredoxin